MTCITIEHWLPANHSDSDYPLGRHNLQHMLEQQYRYSLGGFDLLKRVKHYASPNIISVTDPLEMEDCWSLTALIPQKREELEEFLKQYPGEVKADTFPEVREAYQNVIKSSYPGIEWKFDNDEVYNYNKHLIPRIVIWKITIEFLDNNINHLFFLNKTDADRAVYLLRSAL